MDLTLLFAGALITGVMEVVKYLTKANKLATMIAVLVLSLALGAASWYLKHAGLWDSFFQILVSASAVYALIVKNTENVAKAYIQKNS